MNPISTSIRNGAIAPALIGALIATPTLASGMDADSTTISGTVTTFKAGVGEDGQERGLVRVRLDNGREAIVDLGSRDDVRNLDIAKGDHLEITGTKRQSDGRSVLDADRVRVRNGSARQGSTVQVKLDGEIADLRSRSGERVVTVKLANGKRCEVRIPSRFSVSTSAIEDAERISVIGTRQNRDGSAILAQRLRLDGREVRAHGDGQTRMQRSDPRRTGARPSHTQRSSTGEASLNGTIASCSRVRLGQGREDRLLAKVHLRDGSQRIVDFGGIGKAKLLQLSEGDRVEITGTKRRIGDKQVLQAERVRITDSSGDQRSLMRRPSSKTSNGEVLIQGTVEGIKSVRIDGRSGQQQTVMRLKLEDGESQLINLSPWLANQFLDIDRGDEVVASGVERKTRDGREVLIVEGMLVIDPSGSSDSSTSSRN